MDSDTPRNRVPEETGDGIGQSGARLEERSPAYLRLLLALLLPAALSNAYDSELRAVLLIQLKASFHVGTAAIGLANIPIGAGQFVAFVVLRADRIGRRPILLWSILGYTVFTTLASDLCFRSVLHRPFALALRQRLEPAAPSLKIAKRQPPRARTL